MPTSVDWVKDDQSHMVAAYTNADCVIYDIETGNPVIKLDTMSVSTFIVIGGRGRGKEAVHCSVKGGFLSESAIRFSNLHN